MNIAQYAVLVRNPWFYPRDFQPQLASSFTDVERPSLGCDALISDLRSPRGILKRLDSRQPFGRLRKVSVWLAALLIFYSVWTIIFRSICRYYINNKRCIRQPKILHLQWTGQPLLSYRSIRVPPLARSVKMSESSGMEEYSVYLHETVRKLSQSDDAGLAAPTTFETLYQMRMEHQHCRGK